MINPPPPSVSVPALQSLSVPATFNTPVLVTVSFPDPPLAAAVPPTYRPVVVHVEPTPLTVAVLVDGDPLAIMPRLLLTAPATGNRERARTVLGRRPRSSRPDSRAIRRRRLLPWPRPTGIQRDRGKRHC